MLRRYMVQVPAWRVLAAPVSHQLLRTLLREDEEAAGRGGSQRDASAPEHKPLPDLDFVINFGDAPKAIHLPDGGRMDGMGGGPVGAGIPPAGAELSALRPPPACAAFNFSYAELERAPQGPFGVIPSEHMPLHTCRRRKLVAAHVSTRLQP